MVTGLWQKVELNYHDHQRDFDYYDDDLRDYDYYDDYHKHHNDHDNHNYLCVNQFVAEGGTELSLYS